MKAETYCFFVVFTAIIFNYAYCESTQKALRKISASFGETVWECRKEVIFSMDVIDEFLQYWKPSYVFRNPELGCVAVCVLIKLQLVDHKNRVLESNTIGFMKANYADDRTARQLLNYWLSCHRSDEVNATYMMDKEPCAVGLSLAKCFRNAVMKNHQQPISMYDIYNDEYGYQ